MQAVCGLAEEIGYSILEYQVGTEPNILRSSWGIY